MPRQSQPRHDGVVEELDLRRLAQFTLVAQSSSLTAAAAQLCMTQQALSTSIRKLEQSVGARLFRRVRRGLELTDAGRLLLEGSAPVLAAARRLRAGVARLEEGEMVLNIGRTPAVTGEESFRYLAPVRAQFPAMSITVQEVFPFEIEEKLISGDVDVVLRRGTASPTDLTSVILGYDPLHLAMRVDHPLAGTDAPISMGELADRPIMVWGPVGKSHYTDVLLNECRRHGFEPTLVVSHLQGTPPITAVAENDCVAFVTTARSSLPEVHIRPIIQAPRVAVQALWLKFIHSPAHEALIRRGATAGSPAAEGAV